MLQHIFAEYRSRDFSSSQAQAPSALVRWILLALVVAVSSAPLVASDTTALMLNARLGFQLGVDSRQFFAEYQRTTQLSTNSFDVPLSYGAAVKYAFGDWNVGLNIEYWTIGFGEEGEMRLLAGSDSVHRQLQESFNLDVTPLLLSVEYMPFDQQFRNYVGIAGGAAMIHTRWTESVQSLLTGDNRVGGTYIDNKSLNPMARIYCGVVLGFDQFNVSSNGSLIIEACYSWCANSQHPWKQLAAQEKYLSGINDIPNNIGITSLSLALGVQFSFHKKGS